MVMHHHAVNLQTLADMVSGLQPGRLHYSAFCLRVKDSKYFFYFFNSLKGFFMKKILLLCFVVLSNTFIKPQQITNYECLLKDKGINSFTKVSAPSIYLERTALSKPQTATFSVTFTGTGWTTQKQDAFNYAVDIWEYLINSSQQIKINAERKALGANSGILAGTRPLSYYKDFTMHLWQM